MAKVTVTQEHYTIYAPTGGYYTSMDAIKKHNKRTTVKAGKYYVYNEANGAINVTTVKGVPGSWINTDENDKNKSKNNSTKSNVPTVDPSNTNSISGVQTPTATTGKNDKYAGSGAKADVTCYIKNMVTGSTISFGLPNDLSDSISATFDDTNIRGRSSPIKGYDSSGPRSLSYSLILHNDYCPEGLYTTIAKLKALCYPGYSNTVDSPSCYVRLGKAVKGLFVMNSVGVTYEKPYVDGMYVKAEVSLDLSEAPSSPLSASEVENGGGMG